MILRIQKILLICLFSLVIIIIFGTVYGFFLYFIPEVVNSNERRSNDLINHQSSRDNLQGQTFTGIGQLRIPTADQQPGMLIIHVLFYYDPNDRVFTEELIFRIREFRDIISIYFNSYTIEELNLSNEETIKKDLLERFNSVLRLGKIDELFFSDFMIIA